MPWGLPGVKIIREWSEEFKSGDAAHGIANWIEYKPPGRKSVTMVKNVIWLKNWEGCKYF